LAPQFQDSPTFLSPFLSCFSQFLTTPVPPISTWATIFQYVLCLFFSTNHRLNPFFVLLCTFASLDPGFFPYSSPATTFFPSSFFFLPGHPYPSFFFVAVPFGLFFVSRDKELGLFVSLPYPFFFPPPRAVLTSLVRLVSPWRPCPSTGPPPSSPVFFFSSGEGPPLCFHVAKNSLSFLPSALLCFVPLPPFECFLSYPPAEPWTPQMMRIFFFLVRRAFPRPFNAANSFTPCPSPSCTVDDRIFR